MKPLPPDRRRFLALGAGAASLVSCAKEEEEPYTSGAHMRPYGHRSPYEKPQRIIRELTASKGTGSSRTPLADIYGIITPSALHYERHHAGVPDIDPPKHSLLIHGLVEKPLVFSLDEIRRYPPVSRIYFLECAGNSVGEPRAEAPPTVQGSHGLLSCTEWTGVRLSTLLNEARLEPQAKWVIAEGADACRMARSIPLEKCLKDTLVVYGQNGEALRPEQGYPLRLIVPGWEGNVNVKWLHRLNVADQPAMSVKETAYYTELMPSGKAQIFTFEIEARSVITRPSGGHQLPPGGGLHEITGLAWSGKGRITRVEVSSDGGKTWAGAELQEPVLPLAVARFRFPWQWDGKESVLQSRCTDESGYLQPSREEWIAVRGLYAGYHFNAVKSWFVRADGSVKHV
jgi:sulfane dehydrogenase subunit SoxC